MAAGDTAELLTGELLPCGFFGTDAEKGCSLAVPRRYRLLARACKRVKGEVESGEKARPTTVGPRFH